MKSLDFRRDNRSLDVFRHNIKDFTQREHYWGLALRIDFCERGKICKIQEHGVDNDGKLILNRLPNYNVDKIFKFNNGKEVHIEIKTIPEYVKSFFTFKISSLKSCVDEKAYILVPRENSYYLISHETIIYILNKFPKKIYDKFSKNDLAVRLYSEHISEFVIDKKIIMKNWKDKAKQFIYNNYDILFKEKKI